MPSDAAPTISVVVPVYNAGKYLAEALDSVLAQTVRDFELICVNDGSTDGSAAVLADYAARDPRVVVVTQKNGGIVPALNAGLAKARGEFVARMDADDLIRPERFEKQLAFLRDHPDHVAVGCQCMLIDQDGNPICVKKDLLMTHEAIDAAHLDYGWPIVHAACMFRRSALEAIGGYRKTYQWLEDLDLFLRLAEVGKLGNVPDVLFLYRQNFASVCYNKFEEQGRLRQQLYKEVRERRRAAGMKGPGVEEPTADVAAKKQLENDPTRRASDLHLLWTWWALGAKNIRTARLHAWKRLKLSPLSVDSWRAAFCAARGH